jgi:site-specific recombinase XerC
MENTQPGPAVTGVVVTTYPVLRLAVAAYRARFKVQSRLHTESDLRGFLAWCESRDLDPLAATRPHIELYVRWLQEVRRYRPSTITRRMSVVAGINRTCVIDAVLEPSPAEYVRRPNVPAESPTLGLTHLQVEALLTTSKHSTNRGDFALVTMLGLLGLRTFEATGSDIDDRGEEDGHRVLWVRGKGDKVVLVPTSACRGSRHRTADAEDVRRLRDLGAAVRRGPDRRTDPVDPSRHPNGSTLCHSAAEARAQPSRR